MTKQIWNAPVIGFENGKWTHGIKPIEVRIMALAKGYAMIRLKGAMPFVVPAKELVPDAKLQLP